MKPLSSQTNNVNTKSSFSMSKIFVACFRGIGTHFWHLSGGVRRSSGALCIYLLVWNILPWVAACFKWAHPQSRREARGACIHHHLYNFIKFIINLSSYIIKSYYPVFSGLVHKSAVNPLTWLPLQLIPRSKQCIIQPLPCIYAIVRSIFAQNNAFMAWGGMKRQSITNGDALILFRALSFIK